MFANTAVAAACAGAALILAGMSSRWMQRLSGGLGAIVLVIGGATLFQHISGIDAGIDELLVHHLWGIKAAVAPGRMGPPASTCFTLIGTALLLLRGGARAQRAAPVLGTLVGVLSMLSLIGYLLGAQPLFSLASWTGIAFQTASILFALGLALVVSVPDAEPAWTFSQNTAAGVLARRSLPLIVVMCVTLGWLRVRAQNVGLVDTAMGTATLVLMQIILFSLLLWWCVRAVASRERRQQQAEDALRESEGLLSAVMQQLPVGLGVMDTKGEWLVSNPLMDTFVPKGVPSNGPERISHWRAYNSDHELIPPESWPGQSALRGEAAQATEMLFIDDDGRERWMSVSAAPLRENTGAIIGATCVVQDIDAVKRAEQALRTSEARLSGLINSAMDAVIVVDAEQRVVLFNPAAEEMFKCAANDVVGGSLDRFIPVTLQETHRKHIASFGHTGVTARRMGALGALSGVRSNGHEFPIEASISHLELNGQKLSTVILRDITERKLAEAERERLLQTEHELRAAAEEANRLKDEFLAIMSHELRNPLNVILGYSELFLLSEEIKRSPQLLRMAEAVKRNALAQSRLIRDLLDLSRLRSGKISLSMETVSLLTSINNAVETVRADAGEKQIAIEVLAPGEPLFVEGDPVRLEQVVWNLLNNSVKFTPDGGKIKIRLAKENNRASLTIEDTGQGIDASFLPHVFELFRQGDASTSRAQTGMGIGLAVVHQLVDLHKGSISAYSAGRGAGATFTLELPLSLEAKMPALQTPGVVTSLNEFAVLVVDDLEDTSKMVAQLLRMSGAIVIAATSGEDGLRILAEKEFDAVISDIAMPGMDGFEFLRRLRELPGKDNIPVLALTGFGRPEDIERARAAGFHSYVTKPFELETLMDVLKKLPKRRGNGDGSKRGRFRP
jgi:PAS domain S-box-containing protein